ncbi:MAG: tRNA dihydrouridine synthase DusB [Elusimicrobia bacterium]|nr:tRNA dihydrouridine synthase DusB [Elusimicrobiota bacterium]
MNIRSILAASPVRLAPMADITNIAFRLIARECGSRLVTTEEIDAKALLMGSESTRLRTLYLPQERPIIMQLLGCEPDILAEAAQRLQEAGADIIDLNMGCPVPKIVKKGEGAALMKDPLKAAEILRSLRRVIRLPFTVKIRSGWDEKTVNAVEIAKIAEAEGVDAIAVHPRTRAQRFSGQAPWDVITDVVRSVNIPVTGNGDVRSWADARRMMNETGAVSVMIGRGALGQPWVFDAHFEELDEQTRWARKYRVIKRHQELIHAHVPESDVDFQVKKNLVWYSKGMYGSAALRQKIFTSKSAGEAWALFKEGWFKAVEMQEQREAEPQKSEALLPAS